MLNEIEEFNAYTQFKRDMSFLGRFTFDMLLKQIGLHRVLTIIARGHMYATNSPDIEHARCALQAWCSLPAEKKDDWKANTNFSELYDIFPELVDKDGCGWFYRHVHMISSPNWLIKTAAVGFTVMFTTSVILLETIPIPLAKQPSKNAIR